MLPPLPPAPINVRCFPVICNRALLMEPPSVCRTDGDPEMTEGSEDPRARRGEGLTRPGGHGAARAAPAPGRAPAPFRPVPPCDCPAALRALRATRCPTEQGRGAAAQPRPRPRFSESSRGPASPRHLRASKQGGRPWHSAPQQLGPPAAHPGAPHAQPAHARALRLCTSPQVPHFHPAPSPVRPPLPLQAPLPGSGLGGSPLRKVKSGNGDPHSLSCYEIPLPCLRGGRKKQPPLSIPTAPRKLPSLES